MTSTEAERPAESGPPPIARDQPAPLAIRAPAEMLAPADQAFTYQRDPATQRAFEEAVTTLRATDSWVDGHGNAVLNADLVLEGGGVKGIGLAGAIAVLAEAGYQFPRIAGTSAGAIVAVILAGIERAGASVDKLTDYLRELKFTEFIREGSLRHLADAVLPDKLVDAAELLVHPGLYSGAYLFEWLTPILSDLGVTTFGDLRLTTADDPGISLPPARRYRAVVHVSDITRGVLVHLPWDFHYYGKDRDAERVVDAVRASMSIPFFFEPVRVTTNPTDVEVPEPDGTPACQHYPGGEVTWVDGGMLANFPITAFDRIDGKRARWPTIGIKLSAQQVEMPPDVPAKHSWGEALRCLHTMMNEWDRYHVEQTTADRTIFVDNAGITATKFDLSVDDQRRLYVSGAQAATTFLIEKARAGGVPKGSAASV